MPRAILKNGVIQPLDPLPPEWKEGQELVVNPLDEPVENDPDFADKWFEKMERLCADSDPEDEARLEAALAEIQRMSKPHVTETLRPPVS